MLADWESVVNSPLQRLEFHHKERSLGSPWEVGYRFGMGVLGWRPGGRLPSWAARGQAGLQARFAALVVKREHYPKVGVPF